MFDNRSCVVRFRCSGSPRRHLARVTFAWMIAALTAATLAAAPGESKRLDRAKDLIADEQWASAIAELKAAAADPKEPKKDEVLFWLAHSQNQAHDSASAIETIGRLEREHPRSPWIKPAGYLRLELAQRLRRNDVLWYTAAPRPPVPPVPPTAVAPPPPPRRPPPRVPRTPPQVPVAASTAVPPAPPTLPVPQDWLPPGYLPDTDLRIEALGRLIQTDAPRVIPMLKEIALESNNTGEARRALFVLAQSGRPEARLTVIDVAKTGPEPVRVAAVRELGRLEGSGIAGELMQVYVTSNVRVKNQVVNALGERAATTTLMRIAQTERDFRLRDLAIFNLGEAGGRQQLRSLYAAARLDSKRAIINGLFNAKADADLIEIAQHERNVTLRIEIRNRLRLLGTAAAREYLEKTAEK